jgi:hypothetical protein
MPAESKQELEERILIQEFINQLYYDIVHSPDKQKMIAMHREYDFDDGFNTLAYDISRSGRVWKDEEGGTTTHMIASQYPIPRIQECFDNVAKVVIEAKTDSAKGDDIKGAEYTNYPYSYHIYITGKTEEMASHLRANFPEDIKKIKSTVEKIVQRKMQAQKSR